MSGYPTMEQVEAADMVQIVRWVRHLPLAETDEELEVIGRVWERRAELKAADPGEAVRASKRVGW